MAFFCLALVHILFLFGKIEKYYNLFTQLLFCATAAKITLLYLSVDLTRKATRLHMSSRAPSQMKATLDHTEREV